jgi:hypothetical protein
MLSKTIFRKSLNLSLQRSLVSVRLMRTNNIPKTEKDPYDNIPDQINEITKRKIYKLENHPL